MSAAPAPLWDAEIPVSWRGALVRFQSRRPHALSDLPMSQDLCCYDVAVGACRPRGSYPHPLALPCLPAPSATGFLDHRRVSSAETTEHPWAPGPVCLRAANPFNGCMPPGPTHAPTHDGRPVTSANERGSGSIRGRLLDMVASHHLWLSMSARQAGGSARDAALHIGGQMTAARQQGPREWWPVARPGELRSR